MSKIKLHNYTKAPSSVREAYLTTMTIDALKSHINNKLSQYFPDWQICTSEKPVKLSVVENLS